MKRFDKILIILITLHSVGVGIVLMFFPEWSAGFGGWGKLDYYFFIRQSGIFHLVLAMGYMLEYLKYNSVYLLVTAKTTAFVFLIITWIFYSEPWAVPFSAIADGLMGLVVYIVHGKSISAAPDFS
ncbi:hypothetical protein JW979_12775 [bacterium]|nr:hypothetical protein [candidate division CSSED10-310 bacterium]